MFGVFNNNVIVIFGSIVNVDVAGISLVGIILYDGLDYGDLLLNVVFFDVLGGILSISNLQYN